MFLMFIDKKPKMIHYRAFCYNTVKMGAVIQFSKTFKILIVALYI